MKKILLAGLVAASTVFAQGAMAEFTTGKLAGLMAGATVDGSGYFVYLDQDDASFSPDGAYETDCSNGILGVAPVLKLSSPAASAMMDLLRDALANNLEVGLYYEVVPTTDPSLPTSCDLQVVRVLR